MLAFTALEESAPAAHPVGTIKRLADEARSDLSSVFASMYAANGRPPIPPERLLKASLLVALYSVRSGRAFCEGLGYAPPGHPPFVFYCPYERRKSGGPGGDTFTGRRPCGQ